MQVSNVSEDDKKAVRWAADRILKKWEYQKYAYIGVGASADPVISSLKSIKNEAKVMTFPMSGLMSDGVNDDVVTGLRYNTLKSYIESKLEKEQTYEEFTKKETIRDKGSFELMDKYVKPFRQIEVVRGLMDKYIPKSELGGLKDVLVLDYISSGVSLDKAALMIQNYYGVDDIGVKTISLTDDPKRKDNVLFGSTDKTDKSQANTLENFLGSDRGKDKYRRYKKFKLGDVLKPKEDIWSNWKDEIAYEEWVEAWEEENENESLTIEDIYENVKQKIPLQLPEENEESKNALQEILNIDE